MAPITTIALPVTVQSVLAARIDRLGPEDKRLLQSASVIGKDFALALLGEIADADVDTVQRGLANLQAAEFIYETRLFPDREYTFKHALTHDVAYGGLLAERRQLLHANIVEAIERLQADRLTEHVDRLAYHATRGALWEKAHTFGVQAGRRAAAQSANRAVLEAFQGALAALEYLPETPRTIAENIDLRFELRDAHFVLSEMASILPHLEKAQVLAERIGDRERMALAVLYKSGFHWVRGEHHLAVETSLRGLAAAEELDSWELRGLAHYRVGTALLFLGDHIAAADHLRKSVATLDHEAGRTLRRFGGLDDQFHETDHGTGNLLADSSFVVDRTRSGIMAGWRQAVALAMTGEEIEALTALSRSRTEPAGRVSRAAMLLGYREKPSFFAVGRRLGVHHQTVQRCVERAMAYGALAALDDRPRPGKEPTITPEAKAWLVSLACDKAKEHGYPHELWTTRLLARHARERGPAAGHQCLARLAQGTVCKLLGQEEIKPHKVRYYLERRDAEFEPKMAEVLCVYREVQVLKKAAAKAEKSKKPVAIVSYDEKPGIQAIATTTPDLPPVPGRHASFARDHEYKRHGTLSLLAGIDLLTGKVHALVRERHRSREFIEFLKLLDAAYPASTAIKLILDNHSAHISRETRAWLDTRPPGRFDFTFTPKHGSWLNLIEGFFSKFARSVLRHIRVTSKHELKQRIIAGIDDVNRHPVIHTWSYKLAEAA